MSGIVSPPSPCAQRGSWSRAPRALSPLEHLSPPPGHSSEAASSRKPSLTPSHRDGTRPGIPQFHIYRRDRFALFPALRSESSKDSGLLSAPTSSPNTEPIRDTQERSVGNGTATRASPRAWKGDGTHSRPVVAVSVRVGGASSDASSVVPCSGQSWST